MVTLDCITKAGSFMTCDGNDGNITLHYITLREDIIGKYGSTSYIGMTRKKNGGQ